jgi:hypothetical protein
LAIKNLIALFFGFTILEIGIAEGTLKRIDELCADDGMVILVQPDVIQDVLASTSNSSDLLERLLTGPIDIQKVDRFTNEPYLFRAERFEAVVHKIMQLGFTLQRFEKEIFDGKAVFLLAFNRWERRQSDGHS